jgi:hypothetical protein
MRGEIATLFTVALLAGLAGAASARSMLWWTASDSMDGVPARDNAVYTCSHEFTLLVLYTEQGELLCDMYREIGDAIAWGIQQNDVRNRARVVCCYALHETCVDGSSMRDIRRTQVADAGVAVACSCIIVPVPVTDSAFLGFVWVYDWQTIVLGVGGVIPFPTEVQVTTPPYGGEGGAMAHWRSH